MQIESFAVVDEAVNQIYDNFKKELKIKQLVKLIPKYNNDYVSRIANSNVAAAFMKEPKIKSVFGYDQMCEEDYPGHIGIDQFANFQVASVGNVGGPIIRDKQPQPVSKQTNRYRKTGSTFRNSSISKRHKQEPKQDLSKYFVIPPNTNTQAFLLPTQPPTQQEIDLQYQLRAMQKKLYFTRKQKKQEQQQQQQRLKALKRKKSPQIPRNDFTFEFNGAFMKRKPFKSDSLPVEEMKHCQSFDLKPKDKKSLNQLLEEEEENVRGRSQLNSRYQRANLFNNSNKRQVSHLPFIKMSQNSKIRQDNRNSQGNKTERLSLKSFSQSLQQKSFKHFSEIERQKKQKQLLQKLQAQRLQNMSQKTDKNPQEPEDSSSGVRRRQSYLMNKYLKKLKEQTGEENRKSFNFNRVGFHKNTAIHNYYKHDFNEERRLYESEVISRVLENSANQAQR